MSDTDKELSLATTDEESPHLIDPVEIAENDGVYGEATTASDFILKFSDTSSGEIELSLDQALKLREACKADKNLRGIIRLFSKNVGVRIRINWEEEDAGKW